MNALVGVGVTAATFFVVGPLFAMMVLLVLVCRLLWHDTTFGDTAISVPVDLRPSDVLQYRYEHPGSTITDAIAALQA